jgi:exopolyphosphatase / guanosine-5'-triphosphate,3'-diphosphate pyrophosphatase
MKATRNSQDAGSAPVAIVDIGSNSVRLVIFEGLTRNPYTIFNEKALCGIGRGLESSGKLDKNGVEHALETLSRYRSVAAGMGVKRLQVVATAAVRDAKNGREFVEEAESVCGGPVHVLSGEEEAQLAAFGVFSGIPDADGLVGDLGGGSLELNTVQKREITGAGTTLPFGPLRLIDLSGDRIDRARLIVDEGLKRVPGLDKMKGRSLYAVGGVWRNIGRIHMSTTKYPVHILHHYEIPRAEAIRLCEVLAQQSRRSLERLDIPRRRTESLPFGAVVMERLLRTTELSRVVISAYGVREGLLYSQLPESVKAQDPLIETCKEWADRQGRGGAAGDEVTAFLAPLFEDESASERRLRRAACLLSDIGWRHHPDYRADLSFQEILQGALAGTTHQARLVVAMAVFYRYSGESEPTGNMKRYAQFMGVEASLAALRIGLGARLAYNLVGPATSYLGEFGLKMGGKDLTLLIPKKRKALMGETVEKRLAELAEAFDKSPKIDVKS